MKIGDTYFQTDGSSTLQIERSPDPIEGLPGAFGGDTILKYDNSPALRIDVPPLGGEDGASKEGVAAE